MLIDLENYWPLVRPGGLFLGDDYLPKIFPGVVQAVHAFSRSHGLQCRRHGEKWLIYRPLDPA